MSNLDMLSIQASLNNGVGYYRVDSFVITRENTDNCHDRYSPARDLRTGDRSVRLVPRFSNFEKSWSGFHSNLFGLGRVIGSASPKTNQFGPWIPGPVFLRQVTKIFRFRKHLYWILSFCCLLLKWYQFNCCLQLRFQQHIHVRV